MRATALLTACLIPGAIVPENESLQASSKPLDPDEAFWAKLGIIERSTEYEETRKVIRDTDYSPEEYSRAINVELARIRKTSAQPYSLNAIKSNSTDGWWTRAWNDVKYHAGLGAFAVLGILIGVVATAVVYGKKRRNEELLYAELPSSIFTPSSWSRTSSPMSSAASTFPPPISPPPFPPPAVPETSLFSSPQFYSVD